MPQNIFDLVESEKGALKNENPAKFDRKIFNALISKQANAVSILVTLLFIMDH